MKRLNATLRPLGVGGGKCLSNRAKALRAVLSVLFSALLLFVSVQFVAAQQTSTSGAATTTATVDTYVNARCPSTPPAENQLNSFRPKR